MILHIIQQEKFTTDYINFINEIFDFKEHVFIVHGVNSTFDCNKLINSKNVFITNNDYIQTYEIISKYEKMAEKIILHSLFMSLYLKFKLAFNYRILSKSYWAIWGGDLYLYNTKSNNIKFKINEFFRRKIIKNVSGIITQIKGDYELAQKWYGARGKYLSTFMYPSNLYREYELKDKYQVSNRLCIQVGNSADSSNNHIEVLNKIYDSYGDNIEIICPLSYGNEENKESVIKVGKKLFGDNFKPLINFIPLEEYLNIISNIDVAIFNHNRQQAVGNITTLLGFGKKIYIRNEVTTWGFLKDRDINVYDASGNLDDLHIKMTDEERNHNINRVKECFSKEKLISELEYIFNS